MFLTFSVTLILKHEVNQDQIKSNVVILFNLLMIGATKTSFVGELFEKLLFSLPTSGTIVKMKPKLQSEKAFGMLRKQKNWMCCLNLTRSWGISGLVSHSNALTLFKQKKIMVRNHRCTPYCFLEFKWIWCFSRCIWYRFSKIPGPVEHPKTEWKKYQWFRWRQGSRLGWFTVFKIFLRNIARVC